MSTKEHFQSSLGDVVPSKDLQERFRKFQEELAAIGAHITYQIHDEIQFSCKPGTEGQVKAIHDKYFPQEKP